VNIHAITGEGSRDEYIPVVAQYLSLFFWDSAGGVEKESEIHKKN